jgi:lipopolysaccharide transport system ATP-binding protein
LLLNAGRAVCHDSAETVVAGYCRSLEVQSRVVFHYDSNRPSITSVAVDQAELQEGNLLVDISFESPFPLSPPVVGLVVYSILGSPVFGSNPRIHSDGYGKVRLCAGTVRLIAHDLPIHPGTYKLSVWLGDWETDYDEKREILAFDLKGGQRAPHVPAAEVIGHVKTAARWSVLS